MFKLHDNIYCTCISILVNIDTSSGVTPIEISCRSLIEVTSNQFTFKFNQIRGMCALINVTSDDLTITCNSVEATSSEMCLQTCDVTSTADAVPETTITFSPGIHLELDSNGASSCAFPPPKSKSYSLLYSCHPKFDNNWVARCLNLTNSIYFNS